MSLLHVTIDGIPVEVEKGTTILEAAERVGVKIPTLCHIKGLMPDGSCRICTVEIQNRGRSKMDTACSAHCSEGDAILTRSEAVVKARRGILDMLLSNHPTNCFSCPSNGECKLQDLCYEYGVKETSCPGEMSNRPVDDSNPFFTYDPNLCILCHRCVNTCHKIVGCGAIDTMERGFESVISPAFGMPWRESNCESCGNCVAACPTGALTSKRKQNYRPWQVEKKVLTTCPHCAVGCQYYLMVKDNKVVGVEAADGPSNHNTLCVKGRYGSYDFIHSNGRLTDPLIKDRSTGAFRKASWEEALDLVASKFQAIKREYGNGALAGFACSRSTNEDIYMLQKMVRTCFGNHNTDNCARV